MDFVSCPRCQEMSPPDTTKCPACGASMDEEPIEVEPLGLAEEPRGRAAATPCRGRPRHGGAAVPSSASAPALDRRWRRSRLRPRWRCLRRSSLSSSRSPHGRKPGGSTSSWPTCTNRPGARTPRSPCSSGSSASILATRSPSTGSLSCGAPCATPAGRGGGAPHRAAGSSGRTAGEARVAPRAVDRTGPAGGRPRCGGRSGSSLARVAWSRAAVPCSRPGGDRVAFFTEAAGCRHAERLRAELGPLACARAGERLRRRR